MHNNLMQGLIGVKINFEIGVKCNAVLTVEYAHKRWRTMDVIV